MFRKESNYTNTATSDVNQTIIGIYPVRVNLLSLSLIATFINFPSSKVTIVAFETFGLTDNGDVFFIKLDKTVVETFNNYHTQVYSLFGTDVFYWILNVAQILGLFNTALYYKSFNRTIFENILL